MAGGIDWFRWHHGSVTDPKFQLVAKKAGVRLGDVMVVWAFVLENASASSERGTIGQLDFETLDFLLGMEDGTAGRILDAMTQRGLIEGSRIARWEARQPKRERDPAQPADDRPPAMTSTERSRRHRASKDQSEPAGDMQRHATPRNASNGQETPRGEERRGEEIPPSVEGGTARKRAPAIAKPEDVTEQTWGDWQQLRKSKRAPVTQTVVDGARDEAGKAGLSFEQFLQIWCRRGSQGLEAAWLKPEERRAAQQSQQSFAERDREAGMRRWEEQTGRTHPDRRPPGGEVIDLQPQLAIGARQ